MQKSLTQFFKSKLFKIFFMGFFFKKITNRKWIFFQTFVEMGITAGS